MFGISFHQSANIDPKISFDLQKVQKVYDNYETNTHAGLTLVMGHPFDDDEFCNFITQEQAIIRNIFLSFGLEKFLILYDVKFQIHSTLIELASQHDNERNDQKFLAKEELQISSKSKNFININYSTYWIEKTAPFDIEIGNEVLTEEHKDQTLRITDSGQIVMKGRAKHRKLLSEIRTEFENEAGIIHKYGKDDDEFFFVIAYLKPDERLNQKEFRIALENCINNRRSNIQLALKIDSVKFIMYQNYSLNKNACLWQSKKFKLLEKPDFPKNLLDTLIDIIEEKQLVEEKVI